MLLLLLATVAQGVEILGFGGFVVGHAGPEHPKPDKTKATGWVEFVDKCEISKGRREKMSTAVLSGKRAKKSYTVAPAQQKDWKVCWISVWTWKTWSRADEYFWCRCY